MKSVQPPADPGYTFTREEVDSLNDGWTHYESDERRAELEAQMPTYHPPIHPLRGIRPGA